MSESKTFTQEQQNFLQGFALGSDLARKIRGLPVLSGSGGHTSGDSITLGTATPVTGTPSNDVSSMHREAQDRQVSEGGKLAAEETAKRDKPPADMWDEMVRRAADGQYPNGADVFLTKFYGLFYVAPAQDSYMCRLRIPGGALRSWQMRGLADLADRYAGGYSDVTTRANLQLREIEAKDSINVLLGLRDLGIINYGAGADNIRNVTASPLSGIDPDELIETLPLARQMHYHIIHHRELHGLPRKFNIAFDGGGSISSLDDTNDIGFSAVRARPDDMPEGIYFRLRLGGITGHKDFARPTGVLLHPNECIEVATAVVRVFIRHGNRTSRATARLKYLLDEWGFDRFLAEVEKDLGRQLRRAPHSACDAQPSDNRHGHIGVHPQRQAGLNYIGIALPVGRVRSDQMRCLADIAEKWGDGDLRLTVWQNLLVPNVRDEDIEHVKQAIQGIGLDWSASSIRAGLVACTGSAGCKFAAAPTKSNALVIADYVEERLELDTPVNIHLTGCHHSCAQHYIGDIGLIATNVDDPDNPDGDTVEGYNMFVGGGYGPRQSIARELFPALPFQVVPSRVAALLHAYLDHRYGPGETFADFATRHEVEQLRELCSCQLAST